MQGNSPVAESSTQPVISSVSESVNPVASALANDQKPKTNSFLVILLSILLFISVSIAGFFAFQNQKLIKEITASKIMPTPVVTDEPIAISDPTADWETYTNEENGYSIKFPKNIYIRLGCLGEELLLQRYDGVNRPPLAMVDCPRDSRYSLESKTFTSIQNEPEETNYYNIVKKDIEIGGILGKLYTFTFTEIEDGPYPKWYVKALVNKNNKTYEIYFDDKEYLNVFDQILSTFRFTN